MVDPRIAASIEEVEELVGVLYDVEAIEASAEFVLDIQAELFEEP